MRNVVVRRALFLAGAAVLVGTTAPESAHPGGLEFGVYLRLLQAPAGSFEQVASALPNAVQREGWQLLTSYDAASGPCRFHARVYVVQVPEYTKAVLRRGAQAAFALPVRLAVYEDELGVHLAVANPQSLARTLVADSGFEAPPAELVGALRSMVAAGFPGRPVAEPYGQLRSQGLIEKTMGIVAGGPFPNKIETVATFRGRTPAEIAERIALRARAASGRWGLHVVYRQDFPESGAVLIGLTGSAMETRSYAIVGAGNDDRRKGFACPGLDHATAFPLEVLVVREGSDVKVLVIDEMFRMKLYFEDAGRMKFAINMSMPGSIENELRDLLEDIV